MPHEWRPFDIESEYDVRQLADGRYELRQPARAEVDRLSPADFDDLRREAPVSVFASNPNPDRITAAMWRMWTEGSKVIPGVRLGGIYADKRCYHNTRAANQAEWPDAYCIKLSLDRQGPSNKAAAIDYTMSDYEMRKRTALLRKSALDPDDPRMEAVREFYGTLNSSNVYGLIKDNRYGPWRRSDADSSHLWHIHISIFRAYVAMWDELEPVVSVLSGETWQQWRERLDDVPYRTSLGKTQPQQLVWGEFRHITWDREYGDPLDSHREGNYPGYNPPGGGWVDAQAQVRVDGLEVGDWYQVRYEVHDWEDGRSVKMWSEVVADYTATRGRQYVIGTIQKPLRDNQVLRVAVGVWRAAGSAPDRTAPVAVSGRWTIRQDR
ncbi:MAG: hypothetical protein ACRDTM_05630 [Micromonosporaceae bacterium]